MKKLKPLTHREDVNKEVEDGITNVVRIAGHDKRRRREKEWHGIIIHHTGVGGRKKIDEKLWKKLYKNLTAYLAKKDKNYVSAHYTIGRQGETTEIIDPRYFEAFHAGKSSWWHPVRRAFVRDTNSWCIGIELVGDGNIEELKGYTQNQYNALTNLCVNLKKRFPSIKTNCIVGHEMVSPGRKPDPGKLFDWEKFFKMLYVRL
jgi:N-acetyl-anhydromuramyl-L-alanine amidase AmpD